VPKHLILRLESPLLAFGGETIDNLGVIRGFPALSMVTGLLANAMGWDRSEGERHNNLQARLRIGSIRIRAGTQLQDFQTAQLERAALGWTTRGVPEGRAGGPAAYESPHLRYRDYLADACTLVALRLDPADAEPTLDRIADSLDRPARPLFIGRKPCMPASRLRWGEVDADSIPRALCLAAGKAGADAPVLAQWPVSEREALSPGERRDDLCDERNWVTGLHGGWRPVVSGLLSPGAEAT